MWWNLVGSVFVGKSPSVDSGSVRDAGTGAHCRVTSHEREMLLKGVTLYSSQTKYLLLRTRKARVEGWQSRTLSVLHMSPLLLQGEQEHGLLTLTAGADRERQRAFLDTYQTPCFRLSCLDSASHPVSKAISVIAVFSPVSAVDTV